jgi:hypothetical protein
MQSVIIPSPSTAGPAASITSNGEITSENPPVSYATTVGMSTGLRDDGHGPYYWDFDNEDLFGRPGETSLNVSDQVRSWINHTHANYGFIIVGQEAGIPDPPLNVSKISYYINFHRQVDYFPSQNPRAPQ